MIFLFLVVNNEFPVNPMPNTYQSHQNINYQRFMPTTSNDMSTVINKLV